jgi:hypothetical protein
MHDWFSKTDKATAASPLQRRTATATSAAISAISTPRPIRWRTDGVGSLSRSYQIFGGANQQLPFNMRARANVSYFSDIGASQQFNTNIYDASRNMRTFGGNVVGGWGKYSLNATLDHSEYFYNLTDSTLSGSWPRGFSERTADSRLARHFCRHGAPARGTSTTDHQPATPSRPHGTERVSPASTSAPQIRYPFKKWAWFTVNLMFGWREILLLKSYEPTNDPRIPSRSSTR